jgi:hypothetical protein
MMDLSQHSDDKVRQAFEYVLSLGLREQEIVECLDLMGFNSRGDLFCHIAFWYGSTFHGQAHLIVDYLFACKEIRRTIARLRGQQ